MHTWSKIIRQLCSFPQLYKAFWTFQLIVLVVWPADVMFYITQCSHGVLGHSRHQQAHSSHLSFSISFVLHTGKKAAQATFAAFLVHEFRTFVS